MAGEQRNARRPIARPRHRRAATGGTTTPALVQEATQPPFPAGTRSNTQAAAVPSWAGDQTVKRRVAKVGIAICRRRELRPVYKPGHYCTTQTPN